MSQPYTYLIGWSKHDKWYYGVRYAKGCDVKDLWTTYFTSSKHVKQAVQDLGNPDVIQIRKVFEDANSAISWETKVLKRMKVITREDFLNKTDNKSIDPKCAAYFHTDATRKKKSESRKGIVYSDETKKRLSKALKGRKVPWIEGKKRDEHSKLMSGPGNSNAKIVSYDGHIYHTKKDMSVQLGISLHQINKLIKNNSARELVKEKYVEL